MSRACVLVVGPTCSGKTTLATHVCDSLEIDLKSENTYSSGIYGMMREISPDRFSVFEHCELLNYYSFLNHHFDEMLILYLDVSDSLLRHNKRERVRNHGQGDFVDIDPVAMKHSVDEKLAAMDSVEDVVVLRITSVLDYPRAFNQASESVAAIMQRASLI